MHCLNIILIVKGEFTLSCIDFTLVNLGVNLKKIKKKSTRLAIQYLEALLKIIPLVHEVALLGIVHFTTSVTKTFLDGNQAQLSLRKLQE